jgi:hypothetical protein
MDVRVYNLIVQSFHTLSSWVAKRGVKITLGPLNFQVFSRSREAATPPGQRKLGKKQPPGLIETAFSGYIIRIRKNKTGGYERKKH